MTDCIRMTSPLHYSGFDSVEIGVDETNGSFGEVSIKTCKRCNRKCLHHYVAREAFSESGRWHRGLMSDELLGKVMPERAVEILENLDWYFYGGSYFKTSGQKSSGPIC